MREIGRSVIAIDRNVKDEIVEYSLRVKSALYLYPDEDVNTPDDYIVTTLIDHLKDVVTNENIVFSIWDSIIERRQVG